jgi:hypothetical protein
MLVSGETSANQPRSFQEYGLAGSSCLSWELGVLRKRLRRALRLIPEAFLVPIRFHALAALVLGNFRFTSFLKRAHSDFQIREC